MAQGYSLHIGLNSVDPHHYAGWSGELVACESDAEDMAAIAKKVGYVSTKLLLTANATRAGVIGAIKDAASVLKSGDIFFLSYSGHGGQLPDKNFDEEDDSDDETWVLFDGELIDDELWKLWKSFKAGVRILVLSDSCHSGTVTREVLDASNRGPGAPVSPAVAALGYPINGRYRAMPEMVAMKTYKANRAMYDKILEARSAREDRAKVSASVRLISGCQDNQLSSDGTFNGLFTEKLLRVWKSGKFKGDYAAFHRAIVAKMPSTQTPNTNVVGVYDAAFASQKPFTI